MNTTIIKHTEGSEFDGIPVSTEMVNTTSEISSDIISWNDTLDSTMKECEGVLDTSNQSFLSYTLRTDRIPQFQELIQKILPPGDMVILVITNPEEQYSYIHIVHETIAMGFLKGQHAGQRNNYYSRNHPHGFHRI